MSDPRPAAAGSAALGPLCWTQHHINPLLMPVHQPYQLRDTSANSGAPAHCLCGHTGPHRGLCVDILQEALG